MTSDDEDGFVRVVDFLAGLPVALFACIMFLGFLFVPPEVTAYPRIGYLLVSVLMAYVSFRLIYIGINGE